jgi:hypothetical protein
MAQPPKGPNTSVKAFGYFALFKVTTHPELLFGFLKSRGAAGCASRGQRIKDRQQTKKIQLQPHPTPELLLGF